MLDNGGDIFGPAKIYLGRDVNSESADDLANYFKTEMPKHNWAQAISSSTSEGTFMTFAGSGDEVLSVQIQPSDVSGYQQVVMVVTVASS